MSAIHLIVVLSIVCFGTIILSLGILLIPALTSAFIVGKDVIYKRYDVYDGLVKRFFSGLASEMRMMRYFPLQLIIIIQLAGIYAAEKGNNSDLASLDVAKSWDGSSLTSWGNTLINGANGIKATSKLCSVYE